LLAIAQTMAETKVGLTISAFSQLFQKHCAQIKANRLKLNLVQVQTLSFTLRKLQILNWTWID
jgi:hypothetical protein